MESVFNQAMFFQIFFLLDLLIFSQAIFSVDVKLIPAFLPLALCLLFISAHNPLLLCRELSERVDMCTNGYWTFYSIFISVYLWDLDFFHLKAVYLLSISQQHGVTSMGVRLWLERPRFKFPHIHKNLKFLRLLLCLACLTKLLWG